MNIDQAIVKGITEVTSDWTASVVRLESLAEEIRCELKNTTKSIIAIGKKLKEAKGEIAHGGFEAWAKRETGLGLTSVRRFMRVAEMIGDKSSKLDDLPPSVLYLLASPSTPESAIDDVIEKGRTSVSEAQDIIEEHKLAERVIVETAPSSVVTPGHVKSIVAVLREMRETGALDPGDGVLLPVSDALRAAITEETYERMMRQKEYLKENSKLKRIELRAEYEERIRVAPLPASHYRVIYADPAWNYGNSGLDNYGHAERHYRTMSIEDICALDVASIADENAVLFLWATSPLLDDALKVIRAWGFIYKTSFVWNKLKHNFGYYNSVRHEFLLIATRGTCLPDEKTLHPSVIEIERAEHSRKPVYFRELIDSLYTYGKRVELFAREQPSGEWDAWGNEVPA